MFQYTKIFALNLIFNKVSEEPVAFNGKKVKVTGQIYRREEVIDFNKTRTHIVLSVPELSPDPYILVSYTGTLPFKRGDNITVYGEYYYPAQEEKRFIRDRRQKFTQY